MGIDLRKQNIIWDSSATKKKPSPKRPERYFTKGGLKLINAEGIFITRKSEDSLSSSTPWIPILEPDIDDAPTTSHVNPLGIYDPLTTLWLQGKGPSERESLKEKEPQENSKTGNSPLIMKVEEYNRKVRENPRDVKAWMGFVSFQVCVLSLWIMFWKDFNDVIVNLYYEPS